MSHDENHSSSGYGDAPPGSLVALVGSQGLIEAAMVEGSAAARLSARVGTPVTIPAETARRLH